VSADDCADMQEAAEGREMARDRADEIEAAAMALLAALPRCEPCYRYRREVVQATRVNRDTGVMVCDACGSGMDLVRWAASSKALEELVKP
jgi:hypothetical protein